ncbi:unnamed protein product [Phytophthora fragariaefolia]|uniref:Unnamed protein product n=1 Tax=Phytophthora fragariaefolia TaxID=1490495 RepID=A0A9W6XTU0_9STRA|nr:unnamed protein product [Phytophthora fragariaefolia]
MDLQDQGRIDNRQLGEEGVGEGPQHTHTIREGGSQRGNEPAEHAERGQRNDERSEHAVHEPRNDDRAERQVRDWNDQERVEHAERGSRGDVRAEHERRSWHDPRDPREESRGEREGRGRHDQYARASEKRYNRVIKSFKMETFDCSSFPAALDSGISAWITRFRALLNTHEDLHDLQLPYRMKNALLFQHLRGVASQWYVANIHKLRSHSFEYVCGKVNFKNESTFKRRDFSKAWCDTCGELGHTTGYHDKYIILKQRGLAQVARASASKPPSEADASTGKEEDESFESYD